MRKLIFLGVLLLAAGIGVVAYGRWAQQKQNITDDSRWEEIKQAEKYASFVKKFNTVASKDDFTALEKDLSSLPKKYQESLGPQIKLKVAILNFAEAEDLLDRARGMQQSLTVPSIPPAPRQVGVDAMGQPVYTQDPPEPPKIHPAAMELLNKATPLYKDCKREVDRLAEVKGDDTHNFRLNYIKGEVYHRYTQLFATQETVRELFNQTVTCYKHALRYKAADTNTVINIELLIRDEQGMAGGPGPGQQQQMKLLNQAAGSGRLKGN